MKLHSILGFLMLCLGSYSNSASAKTLSEIYSNLRTISLGSAPDLQIATRTASQKSAQLYSSIAHWLPKLEIQFSQNISKDFSLINNGSLPSALLSFSPEEQNLKGFALKATMPIYKRAVHLNSIQSGVERDLSREAAIIARNDLEWRLRSVFGNYLLSIYKVLTLKNAILLAKRSLTEAELRFRLGQRTKVDVLRAQANVLSLESKRLSYEQGRTTDWKVLKEYVGNLNDEFEKTELTEYLNAENKLEEQIEAFTSTDKIKTRVEPYLGIKNLENLEKRLAEHGPSYRSLIHESELNDVRAKSFMREEWPELYAQATMQKTSREWKNSLNGLDQSYSVGISLSIPLFIGGSLVSSSVETYQALKVNELKRNRDLLHLKTEIETASSQLLTLAQTSESLHTRLDQSLEIVRLSEKSYQLQKTTMVELLGAQNELIDAKLEYAKTRLDLLSLYYRFAANLNLLEVGEL